MSLLSKYGVERFAQDMRLDLQFKGIPCKARPRRTPEQTEAILKTIKQYNDWRGIHNEPIGKMKARRQ